MGVNKISASEVSTKWVKSNRRREKRKRRRKVSVNNGQLCIANATSSDACRAAWANNEVEDLALSKPIFSLLN